MPPELVEGFVNEIPPWLWGILVVALVAGARLLGKNGGTGPRRGAQKRPLPGPHGGAERPVALGQNGPAATRDLSPDEIRQLKLGYSPKPDGIVDPGEVVWTWVPYAENNGQGKDRPVLIIARIDAQTTAGCYLSTKEHRGFVPVGTGGWDRSGRESFLAPSRVLRVHDSGVRREGEVLRRETYGKAVAAVAREHGIRS